MSRRQAEEWANAIGWTLRDRSHGGWFTDDLRPHRVNIWIDDHDVIRRAEIG